MRKSLLFICSVLLSAHTVQAEYTVKGSVQCPDIVTEDADANFRQYNKWWLLGYISGRNHAISLVGSDGVAGKNIDSDQIYGMALSFCEANPDKTWADAGANVYQRLR